MVEVWMGGPKWASTHLTKLTTERLSTFYAEIIRIKFFFLLAP